VSGTSGRAAKRDARESEDRASSSGGFWEQATTILLAVFVALSIRAFVIEPYRIPSGSMFPTLLIGDHLFVNKFVYGIKIPFTDIRLPGLRDPERGDVVVFTVAKRGPQTFPADRRPDLPREEFVKRIVGLPGDRIEVRADVVFVNGDPVVPRPLGEIFRDDVGRTLEVSEVSFGERKFRILDDPAYEFPTPDPIVIPPGRYFVMGDNRDHSKDSRIWGTVRETELKGPAFVLYWSWDFNGSWGQMINPLTWWDLLTRKMRWERIGASVR
jgi:signal peptidase I